MLHSHKKREVHYKDLFHATIRVVFRSSAEFSSVKKRSASNSGRLRFSKTRVPAAALKEFNKIVVKSSRPQKKKLSHNRQPQPARGHTSAAMATGVWMFVVGMLSLFRASFAINAYIAEREPVIRAGTNLTLHCIVDLSRETNRTAHDVIWYKNFNNRLDGEHVTTTPDENTAALHIVNATFEDRGAYFCAFEGDGYMSYFMTVTTLHVGLLPEPVRNLQCYTTNVIDVTCSWEDGRNTNLKTVDTMHYLGHFPDRSIKACHPAREENFCKVSGFPGSGVRVVSVNPLGSATAQLRGVFDPLTEVRPNPPVRVTTVPDCGGIYVSWQPPSDWLTENYDIGYRVQYRTAHSEWREVSEVIRNGRTSFSITSLLPGTKYSIRVAAAYGPLLSHRLDDTNVFGTWSDDVTQATLAAEECK